MFIAIALLFTHWVGDYALQTNDMAVNKYKSIRWLTIHVGVYAIPLSVTALVLFTLEFAVYYVIINALLHWITDFITSRIAYRFHDRPRLYYPIVGFDQFIHAFCLLRSVELIHSLVV
jgi:hypothetical protein